MRNRPIRRRASGAVKTGFLPLETVTGFSGISTPGNSRATMFFKGDHE
jgi:hypothetical protein